MGIEKIDKNFANLEIEELVDVQWFNVKKTPFTIYGLYNPLTEDIFKRMPSDVAKSVSEGVYSLHTHTSGGRVRFSTDSPYIAIRAIMPKDTVPMPHMPATGQSGFDLYIDNENEHTFLFGFPPRLPLGGGFATYNYALENGDKNVYFLDGETLYGGENACDCTVDSLHPNDLGFYRMAQKIGDVLEEILNK